MDRLELSELVEDDLNLLDHWHQDPRVWRYLTARPGTGDALRVAFLRLSQDSRCVMRAIRNGFGFLGYGLFSNIRMDVRRAEVELVLGPEFQGRGLGGAALRELMNLGFGKLGLRRIEAHVTRGNEASRRMLGASGFRHEGTLRAAVLLDGNPVDQWVYALLREEWSPHRTSAASADFTPVLCRDGNLTLRPLRADEAEIYADWMGRGSWREFDAPWEPLASLSDPAARSSFLESHRKSAARQVPEPDKCTLYLGDRPIGWVSSYQHSVDGSSVMVGICICEDDLLERGIGTRALRLWCDYWFDERGLHRVGLATYTLNDRMRRVAEKLGFTLEGIQREVVSWQGQWQSRFQYGMTAQEHRKLAEAPSASSVGAYYDDLAGDYHLMYRDWERGVAWNAQVLDTLLREHFGPGPLRLLDAACGIGTQVLGLAALGHCVSGSDLSSRSVERARIEADSRGVDIDFRQADMVSLADSIPGPFDVVLACDNAIPHLLSEAEILQAFRQFHRCTTDTGGCLVSVRDYDDFDLKVPAIHPRHVHPAPGGTDLLFDVRRPDGAFYDFDTFLVEDRGGPTAVARVMRGGRYFRVGIATLERLMREAGFAQFLVIRDVYHQPVLIGRK